LDANLRLVLRDFREETERRNTARQAELPSPGGEADLIVDDEPSDVRKTSLEPEMQPRQVATITRSTS
jgi:hypothetical protein